MFRVFISLLLNVYLQSEIMPKYNYQQIKNIKTSLALLQLLINNQVKFVCLWYLPDSVVQINTLCSLVLFSAVIYKRRGKKLISKTIKYKLETVPQRCNLVFFIQKTFKTFFGKLSILLKIWK